MFLPPLSFCILTAVSATNIQILWNWNSPAMSKEPYQKTLQKPTILKLPLIWWKEMAQSSFFKCTATIILKVHSIWTSFWNLSDTNFTNMCGKILIPTASFTFLMILCRFKNLRKSKKMRLIIMSGEWSIMSKQSKTIWKTLQFRLQH